MKYIGNDGFKEWDSAFETNSTDFLANTTKLNPTREDAIKSSKL